MRIKRRLNEDRSKVNKLYTSPIPTYAEIDPYELSDRLTTVLDYDYPWFRGLGFKDTSLKINFAVKTSNGDPYKFSIYPRPDKYGRYKIEDTYGDNYVEDIGNIVTFIEKGIEMSA